jgi:hypothetical protein
VVEKSKHDFPTTLANPANNAGFALLHRLYGYWMIYQTGHFTCLEKLTSALAIDTAEQPVAEQPVTRPDCHKQARVARF